MPETTKHVARQPSASSRFRTFGISRFDALQHATTYEYDRLYRQTKQTRVDLADDDPETNFEYDAVGNLTLLKDPKNNTTQWQYDGLDRVVLERNVFDKDRRYDYDLVGNLTRVIDRNERKTTYAYDRLDRQTAETWYEDESSTTPLRTIGYHYDVLSRMFEVTDRDGDDQMASADYDYNYDAGDRVIMVNSVLAGLLNDVVDITFDQFHDLAGRRVQQKVSYNVTESLDYQNDYTRDQLGRLKQLTQQTGSGANEVAAKRVDFTYNLASQFDTITRYNTLSGGSGDRVAKTQYTYDYAGRLSALSHDLAGVTDPPEIEYGFGYDEANRLTSFTNSAHPGAPVQRLLREHL